MKKKRVSLLIAGFPIENFQIFPEKRGKKKKKKNFDVMEIIAKNNGKRHETIYPGNNWGPQSLFRKTRRKSDTTKPLNHWINFQVCATNDF